MRSTSPSLIQRSAAVLGSSLLATVLACSGSAGHGGFGDSQGDTGSSGGSSGSGGSNGSSGSGGSGGSGSSGGLVGNSSGSSGGGGGGDGGVGPVDTTPACDMGLAIDDPNAASFAKALGICTSASQDGYGLVSATYSRAYGSTTPPTPGQWGLLPKFGTLAPREGSSLGVISSGYGREFDDPAGTDNGPSSEFVDGMPLDGTNYPTGAAPPGFPKPAQGCPQDNKVNDMVDVKLVLKAPQDATGFQFDFAFFSSEWPNYVCSNFNDAFVAYLDSSQTHDNISFDSKNNPVAVNIGFLDVCTPGVPVGCESADGPPGPPLYTSSCPSGTSQLAQTGYQGIDTTQCDQIQVPATLGASTGWLTTTAPIQPGEQFTLDLMIWDAGDGELDSSVLLDHFQWLGGTPPTTVTMPAQ